MYKVTRGKDEVRMKGSRNNCVSNIRSLEYNHHLERYYVLYKGLETYKG